MQTPNSSGSARTNGTTTYVFVFVPVRDVPHFRKRLCDCLASISTMFSHGGGEKKTEVKEDKYPYWTWFLPNPLPPPVYRSEKQPLK